ncbi:MAG: nucleoside phosphorylase [Candidatus Nanopelagicaceae bacterium]|nr:nucleoside phosphorylase [Candidatus Nanopelagicaceae bacterium]
MLSLVAFDYATASEFNRHSIFAWLAGMTDLEQVGFPILEFDSADAIIEPAARQQRLDVPVAAVACFFPPLIDELVATHSGVVVASLPSLRPLQVIQWNGVPLAIFYPGMGSGLSAVVLDRVIAMGCTSIVACGGAGALVDLPLGQVVIPSSAVRDEGASYHYLAPAREVDTAPKVLEILKAVAFDQGEPVIVGKTWTTDGFFRTTRSKLDQRVSEGCITVEMEVASLLAVAERRGIDFGQYLYAGDNLAGTEWDHRDWTQAVAAQKRVFNLAAGAALKLTHDLSDF